MPKPDIERRHHAELRMAGDDDGRMLVGYAAVFDTPTEIGGFFREQIATGAFTTAIVEDDIRALFDHDSALVLGRNRAGTLRLSEDDKGLRVEIDVPDTSIGNDLLISMRRGDINQMSFGFRALKETWDEDQNPPLRTLEKVELFDVSVVTYPAYPEAGVSVRAQEHADEIKSKRKTTNAAVIATRMRLKQRLLERGSTSVSEKRGAALGAHLNAIIDSKVTDSQTKQDVVDDMASAARISDSTVNQILSGAIVCPPLDRLSGFAQALKVSLKSITDAAKDDGCEYDENNSACACGVAIR